MIYILYTYKYIYYSLVDDQWQAIEGLASMLGPMLLSKDLEARLWLSWKKPSGSYGGKGFVHDVIVYQ